MGKIVVTGTGRSGTSFLMLLFTRLGLNTGWTWDEAQKEINKIDGLRGGLEHGIDSERTQKADIIKNPDYAKPELMESLRVRYGVDRVLIPIRNLEATAKSREYQEENAPHRYGGFWFGADSVESQEIANAKLIYNLVEYLEYCQIKFSFIQFPAMVKALDYCYGKLAETGALDLNRSRAHFDECWRECSFAEWIRF